MHLRPGEALEMDCPKKGQVDWERLFAEDSEGNQLSFVEVGRGHCIGKY